MLVELGKELRMIRLSENELLKDMAKRINVAPSYLSAIENGKRRPTKNLLDNIIHSYKLSDSTIQSLKDAYSKTMQQIDIDLNDADEHQKKLGLVFARKFNELDTEQIEKILKILSK